MKAVILAAGKGSRLYPVTYHIPKPLLPLANRITLEYAFDRLKEIGVNEICIVVGENERVMKAGLGDGSPYDVHLSYVRQLEPKGLAHAVSFAQDFVAGDDFVLYLGDAIYSESLKPFADRFRASGCANLNLVKEVPDPSRFGVANVDGERIVKLVEKPPIPESNLAMTGLYFFGPQIWEVIPDLPPSARGEYEITDAIQMLIDRGDTVLAGIYGGVWFDTGTLDSFLETSAFLANDQNLVAGGATVQAQLGSRVVIGDGAHLKADFIEDSVILPGATVEVEGRITHSLVGGKIFQNSDVLNEILYVEG